MVAKIKRIWNDSVWSKVIAGLIVALILAMTPAIKEMFLGDVGVMESIKTEDSLAEIQSPVINRVKPTTLIVHSITITDFPPEKPDGKKWDIGKESSKPDIIYELYVSNKKVWDSKDKKLENVSLSSLPKKIVVDYTSTKLRENFIFKVFDKDVSNNDYMTSISFSPSRMKAGKRDVSLKSIDGIVSIDLEVELK